MEAKYGSYEESYKLVPQFCKMVRHSNKNSVETFSYCNTDMDFVSMTISFAEAIKGWKDGCRSVVGLDACHLNDKCGGVLMDATGLDGQNGLVTLGIGVFHAETIENWIMFLTDLKPLLLSHEKPLTFISDRQKGLLEVVPAVFPDSHHRYCWRHLYNNFKQHFKGQKLYSLLWNATKCYKKKHFYKHMEDMKKENPAVVVHLEKAGFESWSRAFFDDTSKCEHRNNNFSELFNSMAKNLRNKPICRLGILCNQLVMSLFHKRRKESAKWNPNGLVPTAMKLIVFIVNLEEKQCSCLQWKLREFVCQHVVCCLKPFRPDWTKYCSHYYTVAAYRATYAPVVCPFPPQEDWPQLEEHEKVELESAIKIRKSGRPRVKRRRAWDEPKAPTKAYSCSRCKSTGPNKSTCQGGDVGKNTKAKRRRTQVNGATFTFFDRPTPKKNQSSQPSGISKTTAASSSKAKKAPVKASTTSKKQNMSQTKK
ncbi:uncharacterized protein LOC113359017 [Papaver somniferum]|uniref:uncharacterized protein LOC113359017 n=1 Tax=Papaver somniferum TaxID=3469 RepID=UPI000E7043BF|nr:uncharacterized protein LOC113359017 [Papaver somniferum]